MEERVEASGEQLAVGNGAATGERTWRKRRVSAGFWAAQVAGESRLSAGGGRET